ncbi:MAG: tetratricopeptide repeat protein, partial [Verrucomicrobiae bacterium]|nr:tetratricopeptide repeat protein [Verrucomicrobiae bacterium]
QFGEAEECLGDIYVRLNNDMGALQHYQKAALREDLGLGNHAALLKKMAAELARLGMTHEAVDLYEKSVVVDPSDPLVYFDLGTLWNQLGQLDRSIYFFEQAVKVKPDFTPAHLNLASCYFTKGRLAEARTEVQAVLRAEPGNRQAEKLLRQIVKKSS